MKESTHKTSSKYMSGRKPGFATLHFIRQFARVNVVLGEFPLGSIIVN